MESRQMYGRTVIYTDVDVITSENVDAKRYINYLVGNVIMSIK